MMTDVVWRTQTRLHGVTNKKFQIEITYFTASSELQTFYKSNATSVTNLTQFNSRNMCVCHFIIYFTSLSDTSPSLQYKQSVF